MAELVDASIALVTASNADELRAASERIVQSHYENTWIIGFLNDSNSFTAVNNRVHNWKDGFVYCDELRYLGYAKPYTWFIAQ